MDVERAPHVRHGGDLPLSGEPLADLMRAVLDRGRPVRFMARGSSMHPIIRDGDVVTVAPLPGRGPRPGDIAAFVHPQTGGVRVHRVVRAEEGQYFMKGDNALGDDGALTRDRLLGLVVRLERAGRAIRVGRSPRSVLLAWLSRTGWYTRAVRWARRMATKRRETP